MRVLPSLPSWQITGWLLPFTFICRPRLWASILEWKRTLMAHGDAREEKWRGKRRMEWVVSSLALYRNTFYPALLPLMRTPWLPAADWTDIPADINGLVRFAGRPNLVSARVPSQSVFTLRFTHTLSMFPNRERPAWSPQYIRTASRCRQGNLVQCVADDKRPFLSKMRDVI